MFMYSVINVGYNGIDLSSVELSGNEKLSIAKFIVNIEDLETVNYFILVTTLLSAMWLVRMNIK